MAPIKNGRLLYNEIPAGFPEPGKTTVCDDSQTIDLDAVLLHGGFLLKTLILSIDPYLRGKMRDPSIKGHVPAFVKGKGLSNFGVALVLRSENSLVKIGDHVLGMLPFQEYTVRRDSESLEVIANQNNLPWSVFLGIAGIPGLTGYCGWKEFARPQKGDVVFVSAGAGSVGSFVVQLAKAEGLKVIASAGSDNKVAFMKSIGADIVFNYKTQKVLDVLTKEGPINIYWDNVGGEILEAALTASAPWSSLH